MVFVGLWVDWMEDIQEEEVIKKELVCKLFGKKESLGKVETPGSHPSVEMHLVETPSVELPLLRLVPVANKRNLK